MPLVSASSNFQWPTKPGVELTGTVPLPPEPEAAPPEPEAAPPEPKAAPPEPEAGAPPAVGPGAGSLDPLLEQAPTPKPNIRIIVLEKRIENLAVLRTLKLTAGFSGRAAVCLERRRTPCCSGTLASQVNILSDYDGGTQAFLLGLLSTNVMLDEQLASNSIER